jgi:hypothetical protein
VLTQSADGWFFSSALAFWLMVLTFAPEVRILPVLPEPMSFLWSEAFICSRVRLALCRSASHAAAVMSARIGGTQ